jgi:hypothetical protein
MSKQVSFYAIRIVGTDFYMISKHNRFGTFEEAMEMGVFFNQRKNAEKKIKEKMQALKGHPDYSIHYSRYEIIVDGEVKYYTALKEFADIVASTYEIEVRDIELEVVPLVMSIDERPVG